MAAATCPRRFTDLGPWERTEGLDPIDPDGTCSFCGSITADAFMEHVRAGGELGPTDKNYKVYVGRSGAMGKFYFQHLDEAGCREFVDLLNAKRVAIGYPHRFYVLPYFVTVDG